MAYGLIHTSAQRDRHGVLWTNKILRRDYTGAEEDALVGAGADPLRLEFLNRSDDVFDPIKASRLVITVWSNAMFKFFKLYSADKKYHQVETYQGEGALESLYWKGFIDPSQYQEKYGPVPYEFQMAAVDGLTLLQEIPYEESEGVPYTGLQLATKIILDILAKIDHTRFTEYVNVYEAAMGDSYAHSPFSQMKINTDVFKDKYCDEVLEQILGIFNANIRMIGGTFTIYRPAELTGETIHGRTWSSPTSASTHDLTPLQYISRADHTSALRQVQPSAASAISPARKIIIRQDYGNKESWINNYEFKAETIDRAAGTVEGWDFTNGQYKDIYPMSEVLSSEKTGIALGTTAALQGVHMTQTIGEALQSNTDKFAVEFEYGWYNNLGWTYNGMTNIYVEIKCGSYYLKNKDGLEAEWTSTPSGFIIHTFDAFGTSEVPAGFTDWFKFERTVESIPGGTVIVRIAHQAVPDTYSCIKDIKFYVSSYRIRQMQTTGLKPVGVIRRPNRPSTSSLPRMNYEQVTKIEREYVATNDITGDERQYDFLIGDVADTEMTNVLGQFQGALAAFVEGVHTRTASWHTRGLAQNLPLLQLMANERAAQLATPRQFVDMTIMETAKAATALNMIGNLQDPINVAEIIGQDEIEYHIRLFYANRGTFHVKYRTWKLDLVEIGAGARIDAPTPPGDITVDTTQTTVDSTVITTDQT